MYKFGLYKLKYTDQKIDILLYWRQNKYASDNSSVIPFLRQKYIYSKLIWYFLQSWITDIANIDNNW